MLSFVSPARRRTAIRLLLTALASLLVGLPATGASAAPRTLSAADGFTCAVGTGATVRCDDGGVDLGVYYYDTYDGLEPGFSHFFPDLHDIAAVAAGGGSACMLRPGGRVSCVGSAYAEHWGIEGVYRPVRKQLVDVEIGAARELDAEQHHTCAVVRTGAVWCWGTDGSSGEFGDGERRGVFPHRAPDESRAGDGEDIWWNSWDPVQAQGLTDATAVGLGAAHSCAVRRTGGVRCWGAGAAGQLGDGHTSSSDTPVNVTGLVDATAVDGGNAHTCALRAGGRVVCWGRNDHGQLGDGTHTDRLVPTPVQGLTDAVTISAGGDTSCAVRQSGQVVCWGKGDAGQIGDGASTDRDTPTLVDGLSGMTMVSVGRTHACAAGAGPAQCWGRSNAGATDRPVTTDIVDAVSDGTTPATPSNISPPRMIGDPDSAIALCEPGIWSGDDQAHDQAPGVASSIARYELSCAGSATNAAGVATWRTRTTQRAGVLPIAAGGRHTCALRAGGVARCWGSGANGRLGIGPPGDRLKPTKVPGLSGATQIAAGDRHSCALMGDGSVRCWGFNLYGQLGNGTTTNAYKPVEVQGLHDATMVAVGARYTCALRANRHVVCWGLGSRGRLGNGGVASHTTPVAVAGIDDAFTIAAGDATTCAIQGDHVVRCWGAGGEGQLGTGSTGDALTPVQVPGIFNAFQLALGDGFACALRAGTEQTYTSGGVVTYRWIAAGPSSLSCWGRGGSGQLGDGRSVSSTTPVEVSGLSAPVQVTAGASHVCAIVGDGKASCWGSNGRGQLGDGTEIDRSTPAPVRGLGNALAITAGGQHTCATRVDAAPACWGRGLDGELGHGDSASSSTPLDVLGGARQTAY